MGRKSKRKRNKEKSSNTYMTTPYESCVKGNPEFEGYYKIQKICPEEEWDLFINALKSDLPTAFRITGSKAESKALLKIIQGKYFKDVINAKTTADEVAIEPICLPWYPDNLAWHVLLTRRDIRRSEALFKFHNFLKSETASGNISRQEVVSMIPPIALDIKPHHKILDMCAAPGSKTAQLIEFLHRGEDRIPSGFVVANDVDNNRCYMLVHQAKRLSSPNIIITNHDATVMPNFVLTGKDGADELLKFDRILCDVPCSGDGTLRKNPDIWPKWNAANGANLHGIQYRVIKRGCEMLAVGGRAVYSTCSLNPIENEAVISRLLTDAQGSLKLVDASALLPGLKYTPGMTSWAPTSRDLVSYTTPEEVPEKWRSSVRNHMFPPSAEEAERLELNLCLRVLPHHQDTGGFFIAVIEKVKLLPWECASKEIQQHVVVEEFKKIKEPARKKPKMFGYKEDPFIFFETEEPLWSEIKSFYSLSEDFPSTCLLTRCKEGKKKNIYLTSPQVRDIVIKNEAKFKIINTGVKAFSRCDNREMKCNYRLVQEGLWSIFPMIGTERHVPVTKDDLLMLLTCEDLTKPPLTTTLSEQVQNRICEIGKGSCVLVYHESNAPEDLHLELVGWVGSISTRAYIPQSDCIHYLRLLGGDTSKFEVNKFQKTPDNKEKTQVESKDDILVDGEQIDE